MRISDWSSDVCSSDLEALTQEKRANPTDDMLTRLTQVTVDRGDGGETQLTDNEIAGFATLLGGAGAETVTKLIGNAVVLFDAHPDQWKKVADDAGTLPGAVRSEEHTSELQSLMRISYADFCLK